MTRSFLVPFVGAPLQYQLVETKDSIKGHLTYPDKSGCFNQYQNMCWYNLCESLCFYP